jgi:pilus assembly protein Flp/PilA
MKLKKLVTSLRQRGIAMTEYLIILAVVAIAAITVVSLFGKQIKTVFMNATDGLQEGKNQTQGVTVTGKNTADTVEGGTKNGKVE